MVYIRGAQLNAKCTFVYVEYKKLKCVCVCVCRQTHIKKNVLKRFEILQFNE